MATVGAYLQRSRHLFLILGKAQLANFKFNVGQEYKKQNIYEICHVPPDKQRGNWDTGYTRWDGAWFIFCTIRVPGRTGHNYSNRFEDGLLHWYGRDQSHVGQETIVSLLSNQGDVHVFYRYDDRSPFTYAGKAVAVSHQQTEPVQITWAFKYREPNQKAKDATPTETRHQASLTLSGLQFPDDEAEAYDEGTVKQVYVNAYERSAKAVSACKAHYGSTCVICDFDFGKVYGAIGRGYIHVHHLVQLADIGKNYKVDPIKDLRPVCPNCHSMLHQRRPPLSIDELREMIGPS